MTRRIDSELTRLISVVLNPDRGYMNVLESHDDSNIFYVIEYIGEDYETIAEFNVKYIDFAYALIYSVCKY